MKNLQKTIIATIAVVLMLCPVLASAQGDSNDVLSKINAAYSKYPNLKMDVEYTVYKSHSATVPVEVSQGNYLKKGSQFRFELSGVTTINDGAFTVQKDKDSKVIVCAKSNGQNGQAGFNPQDLVNKGGKATALPDKDGKKGLILSFEGMTSSDISKVELYYDPTTFLATEIVLFYIQKIDFSEDRFTPDYSVPKMQIKFLNTSTKPTFTSTDFALSEYVDISETSVKLTKSHQNYQLIDMITQSN